LDRAYSVFEVKSVNEDKREIVGLATTPNPDRMGDIVEPKGAQFQLPLPLLLHHDAKQPVGSVTSARVTAKGIEVTAKLARITEAGTLRDRVDEAWQSIKAGLIRGLSIGFKPLESARIEGASGYRFSKWQWLELSAVTMPANIEATIQAVKSFDASHAASGIKASTISPGATGNSHSESKLKMQTIAEQIAGLESRREAAAAVIKELGDVDPGTVLAADEQSRFDDAAKELGTVDTDLNRLRVVEKAMASAKPIQARTTIGSPGTPAIRTTKGEEVEKGIRFARYVQARGVAALEAKKGNLVGAGDVAKSMYPRDVALQGMLSKAAVAAGNTSNSTWAKPLVGDETSMFADFVEFLRPQTILGRFGQGGIPSLRRVPFRVPLIGQTSGGDGYWVGEGEAKPVTKFDFARTTLAPLKVANIAVITMELMRDSSPSAGALVRDQLAAALRERMDIDFIDPAKAVSAGVSPASITNGITPIPATGTGTAADVRDDIKALFSQFIAANNAPTNGVWIMPATVALSLSLMMNPLGQPEFPAINVNGGTLFGMPVITSEYVPTVTAGAYVILVNASDIYFGDEGDVAVDMSDQASLQMLDNPTNASDGATAPTTVVSLWQTNSVGFRAERTVNWSRRRPDAVALLSAVNWGA
jgi:HK97 family phage prohead protease